MGVIVFDHDEREKSVPVEASRSVTKAHRPFPFFNADSNIAIYGLKV